jgi:CheY-like chemotaxis protein
LAQAAEGLASSRFCEFSTQKDVLKMKLRILSLSADQELTLLRKRVLESAGHEVIAPLSDKDAIDAASERNRFDVAVVCYRMWTGRVREIMRIFHKNNPAGKFLVMVRVYGEIPDLEADRYVVGANGPDALLSILDDMRNIVASASESGPSKQTPPNDQRFASPPLDVQ